MVDVVSTAFLGVTVKCARCHDHKFDPIPQRDYYRLAAAFWPGAIEPRSGALMGGPNEEELGFKGVFGWTDIRKDPPPLHLLENGEVHRKGPVVEPGLLSLVPVLDRPLRAPAPGARTTGRRAQWAEFIVDWKNPLTARVMVNRVWQHLFGEGIVREDVRVLYYKAPRVLLCIAVYFCALRGRFVFCDILLCSARRYCVPRGVTACYDKLLGTKRCCCILRGVLVHYDVLLRSARCV